MDHSTALLFNTTADVLRQKDCKIAEQASLINHQQNLLAEKHAETTSLKKRIEELQSHAAALQGRVYDQAAELAALKSPKTVQNTETQTEPVEVQDKQVQTKKMAVQQTEVQTDMQSFSQEAGIDHYPLVFWKPKQESTLIKFAQDSVRRFWTEVAATCSAVAVELAEIGTENALLQADEELDTAKDLIRQAKADIETREAQQAKGVDIEPPQAQEADAGVETPQAKKAAKKKRAAKPTAEERAAQAEADLKAHKEAVRARQEEERRQKAQVIADRKAKMQARDKQKEPEQVPEQEQKKAAGGAKAGKPDTSVLSTAQSDAVHRFARITQDTFLSRENKFWFESMDEGMPALLVMYVQECLGSKSWKLKQVDQHFMLVADLVIKAGEKTVSYASPRVSGQDIVLWVERADFVNGCQLLFKHVPVSADELKAETIMNAFALIKKNWAFGALKLREADLKDDYGLAMQHITTSDQGVMTVTVLKLIIWFRQGRIKAMATCVDPRAAFALLDSGLGLDDF